MPILILLIWLLLDLIVWAVQAIIWMAGVLIQIFVAFPATILVVLGWGLLWALLSSAAWSLLLVFIFGASIVAAVAGHKYLKGALRLQYGRLVRDPRSNSSTAQQLGRRFGHGFNLCGEIYMTPGKFTYGSAKSVEIDGHLFEVRVPGGRAPSSILQLNGRRLRSDVNCTEDAPDSAVLSIKLLAIE